MNKILSILFMMVTSIFFINTVYGQSCGPSNLNGSVRTISCAQTCTNLNFKVPHLKSTGDYILSTIPYNPFPFIVATGGTEFDGLYSDDEYSNLFTLPFPFCFYDSSYNKAVIGSNGLITFDENVAGCANAWTINNPIPFNSNSGSFSCSGSIGPYYPKTAIMPDFSDLDPRPSTSGFDVNYFASPPDRKIQWRVEGTAPCRRFVVSFFHIGTYGRGSTVGSLSYDNPTTFQVILFEGSGIIEYHVLQKLLNSTTNNNTAIMGIQDFTRNRAVAAPGRNNTVWTATNEGWRFTPSGGASRFVKSELLTLGLVPVALADTATSVAGQLDLNFPNICPVGNSQKFIVRTTFAACVGATDIVTLDTITINRITSLPATATFTQATCGNANGTVTVNVTPGNGIPPFQYSLDASPLQASNLFINVAAGAHTVYVKDAAGCDTTFTINVTATASLTSTLLSTTTSCNTSSDGSITVTATQGTGPYTYILTGPGGPRTNTTGVFTGLATGTYTINFTDAAGCTGTRPSIILTAGIANPTASTSATGASCNGASNGSITINVTPVGIYTYTLNPGNIVQVNNNVFTGLAGGTYSISYVSTVGCSGVRTGIFVASGSTLNGAANTTATSCPGAANGTATILTTGPGPFTFTVNPGNLTQTTSTFTGLAAGNYTATFTNATNCTSNPINFAITNGPGATGTASSTGTSCNGAADGTVTVIPGAPGTYSYTLNPGNITQASPTFTGLAAGAYTVSFSVVGACSSTPINVSVAAGTALVGSTSTTPTTCATSSDGTITVTPSGSGPYSFTINPGNITQTSNVFTGLAAGTYSVSFTTASGCNGVISPNITIAAGPNLTSNTTLVQPVCNGINNGSVTINHSSGNAPYTYTLAPSTIAQASPTFTGLAPGTYTYGFTDAGGCTGSGTFTLTTNLPISANASFIIPLCNGGNNGSVSFLPTGGVAGFQYLLLPATTFQSSNTFNGLTASTYNFRIRDNVGCLKDTTIVIDQPVLLTASASNDLPATCNGNDGKISITATGGTPSYNYSIDNGATYSNANTIVAPALGNYPNIRVRDANGCIANATATVALNDTMRLDLGVDSTICAGGSIVLQPQTNSQTTIFNWTTLPGSAINSLNSPTIKNPTASPTAPTSYILNATWGACSRKDTVFINVLRRPIANAGSDITICPAESTTLTGTASNVSGTVNYSWSPVNTLNRADSNVVIATPPIGVATTYTLTVTDNYGCNFKVTDDVTVIVRPRVNAFAGNDSIAATGLPHQLLGSGGSQYLWSPAAPLNNAAIANPIAKLTADTRFILRVTDVIGCLGYDTVFIKVYNGPNYFVPNAFTPNGDGRNDLFRAIPSAVVTTEYFRVFDRWGTLVFETSKWLAGWDGTYKGRPSPAGAYVWIIKGRDTDGKTIEKKGTVILIR